MPRLKKKWTISQTPSPKNNNEASPRTYMNLKQAADYLGVKLWTIRGLISKGLLVAKPVGKYFIVRRVDLDAVWRDATAPEHAA